MKGQVFPSMREALHFLATGTGMPQKQIAGELDWSPTTLSLRTTPGLANARPFPANDLHDRLIRIQQVTGDFSPLLTMADKLGFEVVPKRDRTGEVLAALRADVQAMTRRIEQLSFDGLPAPVKKK